jgi:hypothetical protein
VSSRAERQAFAELGEAGILSVLAAGNENGDNDTLSILDFDGDGDFDSLAPAYPATYSLPEIMSVSASNHRDRYAYSTACAIHRGGSGWPCTFTNWGYQSVDVAAPGADITSTVPGGYDVYDGTSMAAPHVAGVAGLLRSMHPGWTPVEIKRAIMSSVDRPTSLDKLRSFPELTATGEFVRTDGRLNAKEALVAPTKRFRTGDGNINGAKRIRRSRSGKVKWPKDTNDVFKKRLRKGHRYKVILDGPSNRDLDLAVYKPGTTDIWQLQPSCPLLGGSGPCYMVRLSATKTADEATKLRAKKTGTYYFHVSSFFDRRADYRLRIRKV